MQVILDHLAALIIVSVLVLIFALLQVRGVQSASETTVNAMVRGATLDISFMLEKDIANMRTEAQATAGGISTSGGLWCSTTASGDTTLTFSFVTLSDPYAPIDAANPDSTALSLVEYRLVREPGASVSRQMGAVTQTHPLYRLERVIDFVVTGQTQPYVTFFDVEFAQRGIAAFTPTSTTTCPTELTRVRFQLQMAQEGIERIAADQLSNSQLNFSRYGSTIDLPNWE
ncbi:MAG: hypothetical protein SH809_17830 [Rhodothermales bacterium]|nr:hypothetical protein [Rhodothermales bacterium]